MHTNGNSVTILDLVASLIRVRFQNQVAACGSTRLLQAEDPHRSIMNRSLESVHFIAL
jgi:hypothetical protein